MPGGCGCAACSRRCLLGAGRPGSRSATSRSAGDAAVDDDVVEEAVLPCTVPGSAEPGIALVTNEVGSTPLRLDPNVALVALSLWSSRSLLSSAYWRLSCASSLTRSRGGARSIEQALSLVCWPAVICTFCCHGGGSPGRRELRPGARLRAVLQGGGRGADLLPSTKNESVRRGDDQRAGLAVHDLASGSSATVSVFCSGFTVRVSVPALEAGLAHFDSVLALLDLDVRRHGSDRHAVDENLGAARLFAGGRAENSAPAPIRA